MKVCRECKKTMQNNRRLCIGVSDRSEVLEKGDVCHRCGKALAEVVVKVTENPRVW